MNRFNWTLLVFFSMETLHTHTHLFFWVSTFIVFPVSLLAFLSFLTNPHVFPWHFSGVSSSHRRHHAGSRNAVHFSHDCWLTASCIADFSLHGRLSIILYLFLSSWSVFLLTSLAVHGKIKGNIPLQPPAAHYMRPLSTLHGTFCLLKQPANEIWLLWTRPRQHVAIDPLRWPSSSPWVTNDLTRIPGPQVQSHPTLRMSPRPVQGEAHGQQTGARLCHRSGRDVVMLMRSVHPDKGKSSTFCHSGPQLQVSVDFETITSSSPNAECLSSSVCVLCCSVENEDDTMTSGFASLWCLKGSVLCTFYVDFLEKHILAPEISGERGKSKS